MLILVDVNQGWLYCLIMFATLALALRFLAASPDVYELVDEISDAMVENCDEYPEDAAPLYCDASIDR